jgi:ribosomal protein L16/L10AE
MLTVAGADRLQTGMRGAWGKPAGIVARVRIGQILISVRTLERHQGNAVEALRTSHVQVPRTAEDYCEQELGVHQVETGRVLENER